jgi:hypothetical protein
MIRVIHPDGFIEVLNEERPELETLQKLVGGYIERVPPVLHNAAPRHVIVNEDGYDLGLQYNTKAMEMLKSAQSLFGVVLILDEGDLK